MAISWHAAHPTTTPQYWSPLQERGDVEGLHDRAPSAWTAQWPTHRQPQSCMPSQPPRPHPGLPHVALLAYCTSAQPHHAKWGWQCQCRPARQQQSMALRAPRLAVTTIPGQACPSTPSPPARLRYTPTSMPRRAMEPPSPKSPSPDRPARSRGLADSGCSTQWL